LIATENMCNNPEHLQIPLLIQNERKFRQQTLSFDLTLSPTD
jgi:hypothetical protein